MLISCAGSIWWETGEIEACEHQKSMVAWVRRCFETEDIYTVDTMLEKYLGLAKYFSFERLFPWEAFCIALHLCTFWRSTGMPRWPDLFLLIGRGAGKDGFIAVESLCLVSPYHACRQYDVDRDLLRRLCLLRRFGGVYGG